MDGLVDFEGKKLVEIDMTDLDASIKEKWLDGTPVGGITHYDLLQFILETFGSQCTPRIEKMYAVNNHDKVRPGVTQNMDLAERFGNDAAETMIFRRVHALIYLDAPAEVNTAVAVSWHQLGFTVGIGPNVRVCENGCILDAEHIVSSYTLPNKMLKERKLPLDLVKETIADWAVSYHQIQDRGDSFVSRLKGIEVTHQDMIKLFGRIGFDRVLTDLGRKEVETVPDAALNQSQLNIAMTEYAKWCFGHGSNSSKPIPAWLVMNFLNRALNPRSCDVPMILPQQYAVTKIMQEYVMIRQT